MIMMHYYPDLVSAFDWLRALGNDVSSVWNLCICFSDVTLPGIQWWHWEMSGDILGCVLVTSIEGTHLLWDPRVSIK